jgi:hypothetical protein
MPKQDKNIDKSDTIKKEKYIPKWEHIFNKKWTENEIIFLADEMLEWFEKKITYKDKDGKDKEQSQLWLKDFAIEKRMTRQRISEFKEKSEYFNHIYDICNQIQESRLFRMGLTAKTAMPIFALKNIAGWSEKQDINVNELPKIIQLTPASQMTKEDGKN